MEAARDLASAIIEVLDEDALEHLADRLAPALIERLGLRSESSAHDRWLTARDAAAYLGLSLTALHKLTAARAIPFEQDGPGCRLWFRRSELDCWRRQGGAREHRRASTALPHRRETAS